jgi:hypothetical protein
LPRDISKSTINRDNSVISSRRQHRSAS